MAANDIENMDTAVYHIPNWRRQVAAHPPVDPPTRHQVGGGMTFCMMCDTLCFRAEAKTQDGMCSDCWSLARKVSKSGQAQLMYFGAAIAIAVVFCVTYIEFVVR